VNKTILNKHTVPWGSRHTRHNIPQHNYQALLNVNSIQLCRKNPIITSIIIVAVACFNKEKIVGHTQQSDRLETVCERAREASVYIPDRQLNRMGPDVSEFARDDVHTDMHTAHRLTQKYHGLTVFRTIETKRPSRSGLFNGNAVHQTQNSLPFTK